MTCKLLSKYPEFWTEGAGLFFWVVGEWRIFGIYNIYVKSKIINRPSSAKIGKAKDKNKLLNI